MNARRPKRDAQRRRNMLLMKKNRFFYEIDWIFSVFACIVCVLCLPASYANETETGRTNRPVPSEQLENDDIQSSAEDARKKAEPTGRTNAGTVDSSETDSMEALRRENARLRAELIDIRKRYEIQSEELRAVRLSAAGVVETLNPTYLSAREAELLDTLVLLRNTCRNMVLKSAAVCDLIGKSLPQMKLDAVESARLKIAADELSQWNGTLTALLTPIIPDKGFGACRILEVDRELGIVVLNVGYRHGARINMRLTVGEGKNAIPLRIVALRPYVSAAETSPDRIGELGAGMSVRAEETQTKRP